MSIQELEKTIEKYGKDIYSFCLYLTGDRELAEELYQDVFVIALEHLEGIHVEDNVKSYLLSIAVRKWKNRKRKFAWRNRIAPMVNFASVSEEGREQPDNIETDILEQYIRAEERAIVRGIVQNLNPTYRIPVLLYYMEGLSVSDIAYILQIPQGTVKSRLSTARKKLRKDLEGRIHEQ